MNAATIFSGSPARPQGQGAPRFTQRSRRYMRLVRHAAADWWEGYLLWHNRETAKAAMRQMILRHQAQRKQTLRGCA